ncbi:helix-turn-helix domain-containing protein [Streptomyces sp. AV19]|uniref:helix-turn-helix domain-containing protein n=1 Tax=Streptomyces sp. AV19 TaxID=2793068 RepID=UPI0018FEFC71|nr:helix-turn-helix domain-containing protein [Streptomyces sp. AV19]MBH1934319.1 helix-turn-helix domain-containing protein [Streptomyces sp. AV19]MDG4533373.1 helix-turn-helix domain-containing protein [Streptomyces sp. AV19]
MRTHPATSPLPGDGRLATWQQGVEQALTASVRARTRQEHGFAGTLDVQHLGYLRVLSLEADPVRLSRTSRHVDGAPADGIVVALQQAGTAALTQDGRGTALLPGDLAVIDLRRPFFLEQEQRFRQRLFRLPGRVPDVPEARLRTVAGRALAPREGTAALLAPLLERLADRAPRVAPAVGDLLAGNVADLLAALVDEHAEGEDDRPVAARDHLLPVVRRYIDEHLDDPGLTPETVARAHRISVRYLHRLFEGEGVTVSRLIQRRRVEECGKELARPAAGTAGPTVSAVALRWGFCSPAHFSRVFRTVYGRSPREWRTAGGLTIRRS